MVISKFRQKGKRVKGRARKGVGESNGGHVHITVSMALTVFVGFGVEVEEGDRRCVKTKDGCRMTCIASKLKASRKDRVDLKENIMFIIQDIRLAYLRKRQGQEDK